MLAPSVWALCLHPLSGYYIGSLCAGIKSANSEWVLNLNILSRYYYCLY
uniref:Uncharacterized protein n=1 Tax=Phakopsora pachyrhizi TaxID=170000 RepID=A0A0S1MIG8_PHAPC